MKKIFIITIGALLICGNVKAIVYGPDNRLDLYELSDNDFLLNIAKSTAAMIPSFYIGSSNDNETILMNRSLGKNLNFCSIEERFYNQPAIASCTGFLVAPNLMVTAGHCIIRKGAAIDYKRPGDENDCLDYLWVFDYSISKIDNNPVVVKNENIYKCKQIISAKNIPNDDDYAIIELDRAVIDRDPLKIRTSEKIPNENKLYIIGHPSGLPSKYADNATVKNNNIVKFFNTNLDSFAGNSGSPVFNVDTHLVEGILVEGHSDYIENTRLGCQEVNICEEILTHNPDHIDNFLRFKSTDNITARNNNIDKFFKIDINFRRLVKDFVLSSVGVPPDPINQIHVPGLLPPLGEPIITISWDPLNPDNFKFVKNSSIPPLENYQDLKDNPCEGERVYRITNIANLLNFDI